MTYRVGDWVVPRADLGPAACAYNERTNSPGWASSMAAALRRPYRIEGILSNGWLRLAGFSWLPEWVVPYRKCPRRTA